MRNIEILKNKLIHDFSKKYYKKKVDHLSDVELQQCSSIAEWWAYIYSVIPDSYEGFSIFDFNGRAANKQNNTGHSMSKKIAALAKDKICMYCWGKKWKEIYQEKKKAPNTINSFLQHNNVMSKRRDGGSNIVIYGQSEQPIGRTMIASIVMREAMRLRVTKCLRGHTYDWVEFAKLFQAIEEDAISLADYRSCDWLVVDNISKKARSEKQTTLISDRIDPFFLDRLYNRQPTILVFKFDIRDSSIDIEKTFGVGIARMIDSKRTFKIPLSEDVLNEYNG